MDLRIAAVLLTIIVNSSAGSTGKKGDIKRHLGNLRRIVIGISSGEGLEHSLSKKKLKYEYSSAKRHVV